MSILISIYTVHYAFLKVYTKFENSIGEKEKWTNKGLISTMWLFSLLHSTTHHYQALYQISES